MAVGIVLVAHVAQLAEGVRQLAAQMAPDIAITAAGGDDEGGIGTSFDKILAAATEADSGEGIVGLYDLGSAQLTAELVAETLPSVRLVDAPLVEGAIAAAVAAQGGADLDAVVAAAAGSAGVAGSAGAAGAEAGETGEAGAAEPTEPSGEALTATVVLPNPLGLHARPAAELAGLVSGFDAAVQVGAPGAALVDATSVLGVVAKGLRGGDEVTVAASGADAQAALEAVRELLEGGFGETAAPAGSGAPEEAVPGAPAEAGQGVPAAPGLAVGVLRQLRRTAPVLPEQTVTDVRSEQKRWRAALETADSELAARTGADAQIAGAHRAFLSDPELRRRVESGIETGQPAETSWWNAIQAAQEVFQQADTLTAERAVDLSDLGLRVLQALGVEVAALPEDLDGAIVVAEDLLPTQVPELARAGVSGVALARGGPTSHAAIIARGLDLPMVVRLGPELLETPDGTSAILDATAGTLRLEVSEGDLAAARDRAEALARQRILDRKAAAAPVWVGDQQILVAANVGGLEEAEAAREQGADGLGLLRTELLYLDRPDIPTEDEQTDRLAEILAVAPGRPVTVRTLDAGGDKLLPALELDPIRNGPLGLRGLRFSLQHQEMLRTQLRAILRAAAAHSGPVSVMAPMVTEAAEAGEFRQMVEEVAEELECPPPAEVGVMVEVPAAALAGQQLCEVVDFVSVGSNDLTQYVMAADRTLDEVAPLYRSDHPAIWRCLEMLAEAARETGCRVAVCGELAADPEAAGRLVDLGVQELSMAPSSIPAVKAFLRRRS